MQVLQDLMFVDNSNFIVGLTTGDEETFVIVINNVNPELFATVADYPEYRVLKLPDTDSSFFQLVNTH